MKAYKITEEQKSELVGRTFDGASFFSPQEYKIGEWLISKHEVEYNINEDLYWIKDLEEVEIDYYPNPVNLFGIHTKRKITENEESAPELITIPEIQIDDMFEHIKNHCPGLRVDLIKKLSDI